VRQSPEDTVAACSDQLPFVLLPVRMETKFARVGDTAELRVRLFPDDIGIAPPVAAVSDSERGLGEAYWRARTDAKQNPGNTDLRSAYRGMECAGGRRWRLSRKLYRARDDARQSRCGSVGSAIQ
jgi:hypothetical protein